MISVAAERDWDRQLPALVESIWSGHKLRGAICEHDSTVTDTNIGSLCPAEGRYPTLTPRTSRCIRHGNRPIEWNVSTNS